MNIAADLILDAIGFAVIFVALVRVVTTPSYRWTYGRLSKAAWVVAVLCITPGDHGVYLPVAAGLAIWHTGRLNRATPCEPAPLPFADGTPENSEPDQGGERP